MVGSLRQTISRCCRVRNTDGRSRRCAGLENRESRRASPPDNGDRVIAGCTGPGLSFSHGRAQRHGFVALLSGGHSNAAVAFGSHARLPRLGPALGTQAPRAGRRRSLPCFGGVRLQPDRGRGFIDHLSIARRTSSRDGRASAAPIALDGSHDEDVWRAAEPAAEFIQAEPHEGEPATEPTDVYRYQLSNRQSLNWS